MVHNRKDQKVFELKRCPNCSVELPLDVRLCPSCKQAVGNIDKLGRAKEPFDWKGYAICAVSWFLFFFFVWWGFFRKG